MCDICTFFEGLGGDKDENEILKMLKAKHAASGTKSMVIDLSNKDENPFIQLDKISSALLSKLEREFWTEHPESLALLKLRQHALEGSLNIVKMRIEMMEGETKTKG